jgi:hypothetical protein
VLYPLSYGANLVEGTGRLMNTVTLARPRQIRARCTAKRCSVTTYITHRFG